MESGSPILPTNLAVAKCMSNASPALAKKVQVSTDGGAFPTWSRDGRRLRYESSDTLWAVDVENSPSFRLGKSHLLYQGQIWNEAAGPNYALSPDAKRLVAVERGKDATETDVNVVLNWHEELLRLAGSVNRQCCSDPLPEKMKS